jgi:hypothetical protein
LLFKFSLYRYIGVVTAAAGGAIRRWDVVKGDVAAGVGHAGEVAVPKEAPADRPAPPPNPRAVAASGGEVMVATAAGDLWLMMSSGSSGSPSSSAGGGGGIGGDDKKRGVEGSEGVEGDRPVSPTSTLQPELPRALIRGATSSAHFVAWHPRREGVFAVAAAGLYTLHSVKTHSLKAPGVQSALAPEM